MRKLKVLLGILACLAIAFSPVALRASPTTQPATNPAYLQGWIDAGGQVAAGAGSIAATQPAPPALQTVALLPYLRAANAGDPSAAYHLAHLTKAIYVLASEGNITRDGLVIKAPWDAPLVPPALIPGVESGGNVWVANAQNVTVEGFALTRPCGIYFVALQANATCLNPTIVSAYQIAKTGPAPGVESHAWTGGINCTVQDVTLLGTCASCVYYGDRNGFRVIDTRKNPRIPCRGSTSEIALRIDTPTGHEQIAGCVIRGGEYSNWKCAYHKAAITVRCGGTPDTVVDGKVVEGSPVNLEDVVIHGQASDGETFAAGNPLLPPGPLQPGYFANVAVTGCQFVEMAAPGAAWTINDFPSFINNRGGKAVLRGCNFAGCGNVPFSGFASYPHRYPAGNASDGSGALTLIDCAINAPALGAAGGKPGTILPPNHPGSAESGTHYWPTPTPATQPSK